MTNHDAEQARVIADVLGKHAHPGEMLYIFDEAWFVCDCGQRFDVRVVEGKAKINEANETWRLHVGMAAGEALAALVVPPAAPDDVCDCHDSGDPHPRHLPCDMGCQPDWHNDGCAVYVRLPPASTPEEGPAMTSHDAENGGPTPTVTSRGFQRHEAVPSEYGGEVRVYESSSAQAPHIWLNATAPENLNDPEGNEVEAPILLTLDNAVLLRDQLTQLIENHYQVRTPPAVGDES